ncbi:diguanylate cyclase domain-containing protein [Deinococcus radiotolerans]|uniref:GGDEF domain-containing protein n=1 Tax=Deinococcus radiotolerans TaxID=1309407 RepID=A0ABQ2FM93_9DEIO|nr:diguanylate cyclase [Deinococcus radiotolerans]GGL10097.1 hypothetical protein GCM10010844_30990 [Deinococcus radiotolerans]
MTHFHLEDDLFHLLPLPALRWPAHAPTLAQPNHAFSRTFHASALPEPARSWPDGVHQTRLLTLTGARRVCRLNLSSLPNGDRILLIEDVHQYHLDPVTHLPDRTALLLDAAQTHGVTTLAALRLPPLHDQRRHLGNAPVDQALRLIARDLWDAARPWQASVYRTGTHEFTLLSPRPLTAEHLAPALRRAAQHLGALGRHPDVRTGLADAPHDGTTLADLLRAAQERAGHHAARRTPGGLARLLHPAAPSHPPHSVLAL